MVETTMNKIMREEGETVHAVDVFTVVVRN